MIENFIIWYLEAGRYFKSISKGIISHDMSNLKDRINSILDKPLLNDNGNTATDTFWQGVLLCWHHNSQKRNWGELKILRIIWKQIYARLLLSFFKIFTLNLFPCNALSLPLPPGRDLQVIVKQMNFKLCCVPVPRVPFIDVCLNSTTSLLDNSSSALMLLTNSLDIPNTATPNKTWELGVVRDELWTFPRLPSLSQCLQKLHGHFVLCPGHESCQRLISCRKRWKRMKVSEIFG